MGAASVAAGPTAYLYHRPKYGESRLAITDEDARGQRWIRRGRWPSSANRSTVEEGQSKPWWD